MREYTKFYITPKGERAARSGHPWVYAEEITRIEGEYQNGDLVECGNKQGQISGHRVCQRPFQDQGAPDFDQYQ